MSASLDERVDMCYGAALLLASIEARVALMEARGEKPPAEWEDGKACVRGIIAVCLGGASMPVGPAHVGADTTAALMMRLCDIARDCGVHHPAAFFTP